MDDGAIVAALAAASGAVLGVVATLTVTRLRRGRSARRLAPVRAQVEDHVSAIAETLDRVATSLAVAGTRRRETLDLSLDLDALLEQVVQRAAALTGAQAAAIRVDGPGDEPVVSSFGTGDGVELLETALGPPDERPFRAVTINWTYGPTAEEPEDAYSSALVVPVIESGVSTGALVAYAGRSSRFAPDHMRMLRELADEAAPQIANARSFARLGSRSLTDALTGIRNRSGYELELEREVARAARTGQPLSLLVLAFDRADELRRPPAGQGDAGTDDPELQELATLLVRTVRATDIPCRRRERELAVVLPETKDEGARRLWARLHRESGTASFAASGRTFAVGLVEWRPDETSDALDARATAALAEPASTVREADELATARTIAFGGERRAGSPSGSHHDGTTDVGAELRARLESAIVRARSLGQSLTVAVLQVDELDVELGPAFADRLREHVAARVHDALDEGSVVSRLDRDRYALVLSRQAAADAQSTLAVLQASLGVRPRGLEPGAISVSAGVAELTEADDAEMVLERAEAALAEARAAGTGTVVVARTGS